MNQTPEWMYYVTLAMFVAATWFLVWSLSGNISVASVAVSAAVSGLLLIRLPR